MYSPEEAAELFAYGYDGEMNPLEYVKLWKEHLNAREAYYRLPFHKRVWETLRGRKPKQWEGV
jgi:hypothetical protein